MGEVNTTGIEFEGAFALSNSVTLNVGFAVQDSEIVGGTPDPGGLIDPATGQVSLLMALDQAELQTGHST